MRRFSVFNSMEVIKKAVLAENMVAVLPRLSYYEDPHVASGDLRLLGLTGFETELSNFLVLNEKGGLNTQEKRLVGFIRDFYRELEEREKQGHWHSAFFGSRSGLGRAASRSELNELRQPLEGVLNVIPFEPLLIHAAQGRPWDSCVRRRPRPLRDACDTAVTLAHLCRPRRRRGAEGTGHGAAVAADAPGIVEEGQAGFGVLGQTAAGAGGDAGASAQCMQAVAI